MKTKSISSIKIAPKLDRESHMPLCGHWTVGEFPPVTTDWRDEDWQKAIDIFEDRIYGRFLNLADEIEERPNSGFSVMALDCLLIETLQQFFEGKAKTPKRKGAEYFGKFLTGTAFRDDFGSEYNGDTFAYRFYNQVRCGILHQGETKEDSRIIYARSLKKTVQPSSKGVVVNRYSFHQLLVKVFEDYVSKLRNPTSPKDNELREYFKKKMKYICRIEFEE